MTQFPHPPNPPAIDRIRFACGSCGASLEVPAALAGVQGPCPLCGKVAKAPTLENSVATVIQRNAGILNTRYQRSILNGATRTPAGMARHTNNATMMHASPSAPNDERQPKCDPISTDNGLPATAPIAQPIMSFPSVGARSSSGTSIPTVAAT